jgi:hypothetical protein
VLLQAGNDGTYFLPFLLAHGLLPFYAELQAVQLKDLLGHQHGHGVGFMCFVYIGHGITDVPDQILNIFYHC